MSTAPAPPPRPPASSIMPLTTCSPSPLALAEAPGWEAARTARKRGEEEAAAGGAALGHAPARSTAPTPPPLAFKLA